MTEAGWTRKKPIVAGWYWWRDDSKSMPHAILVWSTSDNTLQAKGGFWTTSQDVARMDGEWLGPITPDTYQQGRVEGAQEYRDAVIQELHLDDAARQEFTRTDVVLALAHADEQLAQQAQGGG